MSAYSVGTSPGGGRVWWQNYEMATLSMSGYSDVRPATADESALMDKVVWERDTWRDREQLLQLVQSR